MKNIFTSHYLISLRDGVEIYMERLPEILTARGSTAITVLLENGVRLVPELYLAKDPTCPDSLELFVL
jgi:hypothetical protein